MHLCGTSTGGSRMSGVCWLGAGNEQNISAALPNVRGGSRRRHGMAWLDRRTARHKLSSLVARLASSRGANSELAAKSKEITSSYALVCSRMRVHVIFVMYIMPYI